RAGLAGGPPGIRVAALDAAGERRDRAAIPAVLGLLAAPEELVRVAALRALAVLPTPDAEAAILKAMSEGTPAEQAAAADACLGLARFHLGVTEPGQAVTLLHRLLARTLTPAQEMATLAAMGRAASPTSVPLVEARLAAKDPQVRQAAARAGMAIAAALAKTDRTAAEALLRKIALTDSSAALQIRALGCQVDIPARDGVVSAWWVLGPWLAPTADDWETPHPPETSIDLRRGFTVGGYAVAWRPVVTNDPQGALVLDSLFAGSVRVLAYALVDVHLTKAQDVVLDVGSADATVLWLNGSRIHDRREPRPAAWPHDRVKTRLNAGVNRILVKTRKGAGAWAIRLRIRALDGKPVEFSMR
ncbi:HEAT repeat domain-containing protein, partial [bacterium]|nr:HEAT repeat domain-containing protein [bacterium]